ncbi:hypothetical protein BCR44DRAFT_1441335, partial [Catenaria anguillulae PL171]
MHSDETVRNRSKSMSSHGNLSSTMDPQNQEHRHQPRHPTPLDQSLALRLAARLPIPKLNVDCQPSSWLDTYDHACNVIRVPHSVRFQAVLAHAEPKIAQWLLTLQPPADLASERAWTEFYRPRIISRLGVSAPNEVRISDRPREPVTILVSDDDESASDDSDEVSAGSDPLSCNDNQSLPQHSSSPSPSPLRATSPPLMPPLSPSPQTSPVHPSRSVLFTPSRYRHLPPPPRAAFAPLSSVYVAPKHVRVQPDHPSDELVDIVIDETAVLQVEAEQAGYFGEYGFGYDPYAAVTWPSYPYHSGYAPPPHHQAGYYHQHLGLPPSLYHPGMEWEEYSDVPPPPPPPPQHQRPKPPTHQRPQPPKSATAREATRSPVLDLPLRQNKRRKLSPESISPGATKSAGSSTSLPSTLPPRPSARPPPIAAQALLQTSTSSTFPIPSTVRIHILRGISALQHHTGPGIWSTAASQSTFTLEWVTNCPCSSKLKSLLNQRCILPKTSNPGVDTNPDPAGRLWLLLPRASSTPTALYFAHSKPLTSAQLESRVNTLIKANALLAAHIAATGGHMWLWLEDDVARVPSVTDARWVNGLVFPVFIKMRAPAADAKGKDEYRTVNVAYLEGKRVVVNNYSRIGVAVGMPATKFFVRREVASADREQIEYPMLLVRQSWEKNGVGAGDVVVVHPAPSVAGPAKLVSVGGVEQGNAEVTEMEVDEVMDGLMGMEPAPETMVAIAVATAPAADGLPRLPPLPRIPPPVQAAAAPPAGPGLAAGTGSVNMDGLSKTQRKKLRKKLAAAQS